MSEISREHPEFDFIGGNAALDFANTVGGLRGGTTNEHLGGYPALVTWAIQAKLLDDGTGLSLRRSAKQKPAAANWAFTQALEQREAIYDVFSAVAAGRSAPSAALELINSELPAALGRMRIKPQNGGFALELSHTDIALDLPLWAVLREVADLLTADRLARVRECAGDSCSWLFLDTTRNHSRMWCDMRGCGNRAKVRRHRVRHG